MTLPPKTELARALRTPEACGRPGLTALVPTRLRLDLIDELHHHDQAEAIFSCNGRAYPSLMNLVKLNEPEVIRHFQETGEVPPGVKVIKTTTVPGQNVTELEIFHGPRSAKRDVEEET